jgi:hypothetical protein
MNTDAVVSAYFANRRAGVKSNLAWRWAMAGIVCDSQGMLVSTH